jgi:7-cyano-7-deazaguanine synthase
MTEAVAIVSGGLDSCTLLQKLINDKYSTLALSFDYGQRHKKELDYAKAFCDRRGVEHHIVDLSSINPLISSSALTGDVEVPEGHYAEDNMRQTVVPNRNMIMLSIAAGVAVSRNASVIATGVHAGDHFVYPDCRPEFVKATQHAIKLGNQGFANDYLEVYAPFTTMDKAQIANLAFNSGVHYDETWSCYKGGEVHCGKCGTCVERLEAIDQAGYSVYDQTVYEDKEFWKTAVANR